MLAIVTMLELKLENKYCYWVHLNTFFPPMKRKFITRTNVKGFQVVSDFKTLPF